MAKGSVHIEVTSEDIFFGKQRSNRGCAIWSAVYRSYERAGVRVTNVIVDREAVHVSFPDDNLRYTFSNNSLVRKFIDNFDLDKKLVEPIIVEHNLYDPLAVRPIRHQTLAQRRDNLDRQKAPIKEPGRLSSRNAHLKRIHKGG